MTERNSVARTGVDNPWRDDDEPNDDLEAWARAGVGADDAETWRRWRFTIAQSRAWRDLGVRDGLTAAQWSTAGVTPATVAGWRAAGIDAREAVTWHEFGFGLEQARRHRAKGRGPVETFQRRQRKRSRGVMTSSASGPVAMMVRSKGANHPMQAFLEAGVDPQLMHDYFRQQWLDPDAIDWAKERIPATDALLWRELGVTPKEAGRLARRDQKPAQVVRDWWRAGIPFDELAAWLGAGLDPEEAARQRAKGITAEQAAALRALRQSDDDS